MLASVDLGAPVSYLVLDRGTPVLSADGEAIGSVLHVLAVEEKDVFDGIVIEGSDGHRFVDADDVSAIFEKGVVLRLDAEQAARLPRPSANPAVMRADAGDEVSSGLADKLRRAWDRVSGNY